MRAMAWVVVMGLSLAGVAQAGGKGPMQLSGVVNLNTASAAQLDVLPGVGEKAAKRILEYRAKTPFTRIEDLVKVKGFGKKKFDKLKPYVTVSGATTVKATRGAAAPAPEAQGRSLPRR